MADSIDVETSAIVSKRVVFVGGLPDAATVQLVRASMIPFGPIHSVDIPMDYVSGKHKGFAFVEYDDPEDADEAIFNMDGAELLGRVLKVSLAQVNQVSKLSVKSNEAIWKSDEWFQQNVVGNTEEEKQIQKADTQILADL